MLRLLGLNRLKRTLDSYLYFPSTATLFVRAIRRRLAAAIGRDLASNKRVCLITTVPPHALNLLGTYIKRRYPEVHWVADWQDLWSHDENYYLQSPPPYRGRVKRMERRMLATADMNLATNAHAAAVLRDLYGVPAAKVGYINHHFSREDLTATNDNGTTAQQPKRAGVLRIGFLGTLFKPPRVPGAEIVTAISHVRNAGHDVELHIHGTVPAEIAKAHRADGSTGIVVHGRSTHELAVRQLAQYDLLLLLLADLENSRSVMSIKLPHYLMVGKPILAIVPEPSAIADIVHKTGGGIVLPSQDDWHAQFEHIISDPAPHIAALRRDQFAIERFSWEHISQEWLKVIQAAPARRAASGG